MSRAADAIAQLRSRWARARSTHWALAELAACPPQELNRIAADIGLSPGELRRSTSCHPGPSELMPQRLRALGLDSEFVRHAEPELFRDLGRLCANCTAWRRCKRDLARGDVQAGMGAYCLNSATIDLLTVGRHGRQWSRLRSEEEQ
jgi:hypothetical protein